MHSYQSLSLSVYWPFVSYLHYADRRQIFQNFFDKWNLMFIHCVIHFAFLDRGLMVRYFRTLFQPGPALCVFSQGMVLWRDDATGPAARMWIANFRRSALSGFTCRRPEYQESPA